MIGIRFVTCLVSLMLLFGCKQRRDNAEVKGSAEIDKTETSDDKQVWIWCKTGHSHNGMCKFSLKPDIFDATVASLCLDYPPAACSKVGGPGNGGNSSGDTGTQGPGSLAELSVATCGATPNLEGVTVAFNANFFSEFDEVFKDLPASVREASRKQAFCSVVKSLGDMLNKSAPLAKFIRGDTPSGKKLVLIIDKTDTKVNYKKAASALFLPARFNGSPEEIQGVASDLAAILEVENPFKCAVNEVASEGRCYVLDGVGGNCGSNFEKASETEFIALKSKFIGLTYHTTKSQNCCIITGDRANFTADPCNGSGPFSSFKPATGCLLQEPGELTFCRSKL